MVPPPLLLAPAGPQHRQPAGPRRDREGRRVLARARRRRVPRRRRPVPHRHEPGRRCRSRSARDPPASPLVHLASARRRGAPGRGQLIPEQLIDFFGGDDADEVQLLFNFPLMEATWLSLARQDAGPIAAALRETIAVSPDCQYANFLRNHDELTLDKLSEDERQEVFDAFGPEEDMQVFGRGLRRPTPVDAGRRPPTDPDGLQPPVLLPGRPCCSTARRSAWARTSRSTAA